MNNHDLRAIILKLEDRLSDDDRKRLHFFLRDDVPQRYIDDLSLGGTLNLIDSLFRQDLINENNFIFLIDAFYKIRCYDAVRLLKEHKKRMETNMMCQSFQSLSSIMPSMNSQLRADQREDIGTTESLLTDIISMSDYSNDHMNVNPTRTTKDNRAKLPSQRQRNSLFNISCMAYKCFIVMILLLITVLCILSVFTAKNINQIQKLTNEIKVKDDVILQVQQKHNISRRLNEMLKNKQGAIDNRVYALVSLQSEYKTNITILSNELAVLKENEKTSSIKVGVKYGDIDRTSFYDSLSPNFTYYHYLNGLIVSHNEKENFLESIQFLYTSSYDNRSNIKSEIHGNSGYKSQNRQTFILNNDERIYKVQGQITNILQTSRDNSKYRTTLIRGIQFFTTKGRKFPSYKEEEDEEIFSEQFNGYTLGYVNGRTGRYVNQLQFVWYRTETGDYINI